MRLAKAIIAAAIWATILTWLTGLVQPESKSLPRWPLAHPHESRIVSLEGDLADGGRL
jgi:hypothetical protein